MAVLARKIVANYEMSGEGHAEKLSEVLENTYQEPTYIMDQDGNHIRKARVEEICLEDGSLFYKIVLSFDN